MYANLYTPVYQKGRLFWCIEHLFLPVYYKGGLLSWQGTYERRAPEQHCCSLRNIVIIKSNRCDHWPGPQTCSTHHHIIIENIQIVTWENTSESHQKKFQVQIKFLHFVFKSLWTKNEWMINGGCVFEGADNADLYWTHPKQWRHINSVTEETFVLTIKTY